MQQRFITPLALALLALIFNSATLAQEPETEELTTELNRQQQRKPLSPTMTVRKII